MSLPGKNPFPLILILFFSFSFSQDSSSANSGILKRADRGQVFFPGDAVRIYLPLDSASFLNGVYPIDDNGTIVLPITGEFQVTGLSIQEFEEIIRKDYEIYLRFPEVQVTPLIRVSLLGGFARPGMYYVEPQRSMWDLISMAGGTNNEKGLGKMRWERDRKIVQKDLIPLIESGRSLRSIGFKSGDQLWTPGESRRVTDFLVRDLLPIGTFLLSLFVGVATIRDDD